MQSLKHMLIEMKVHGYLGEKSAISLQEFVTICNQVRDWNERMPSDKIKIEVIERTVTNIKQYLQNTSKPLEQFITSLDNPELYYLTFETKDIEYNKKGQISGIVMTIRKKF